MLKKDENNHFIWLIISTLYQFYVLLLFYLKKFMI